MSSLLWSIGQFCGVVAFFLLSFLIFSGDTARFWNRFIGLDKIIKFQKKFSYFVAVFVLLHPLFFIISRSDIADFMLPDFSVLPLALGIVAFYIFISVMVASALYKLISYKAWQYIHVLTYFLFFFVLYHAFAWGSDVDDLKIPYFITLLFVLVGIIYRTQYKLKNLKGRQFKVVGITRETPDTFTITLSSEKRFNFQPGQFCFLRINKNKLYARHPFTISSAPHEDVISFTIKIAGRFTKTAEALQKGDEVLVDGPFGKFIPKEEGGLVFIAGGVGITPFLSVLKDRIRRNIKQKIILFYSSKKESDIIFKKDLDQINEDWFRVIYILRGDSHPSFESENGYIDEEMLAKYIKNPEEFSYYICGPEKMKSSMWNILKKIGVKSKNIFTEDFFW